MKLMHNQAGDTIVEVMVSMAVLSLILAGSFNVVSGNVKATQSAQEHDIAQSLGGSQIEAIDNIVATDPSVIFGATVPTTFCLKTTGAKLALVDGTTPANCVFDAANNNPPTNPAAINYTVLTTRNVNTFTISVTWVSALGTGNSNVTYNYKAYPLTLN